MECLRCRKSIRRSYHNTKKYCDDCVLYRSRRYGRLRMRDRRKNPQYRKIINRSVREAASRLRRDVLTYYSKGKLKCMCLGCRTIYFGFLQLDHIKGNGYKHLGKNGRRISSCALLNFLRKNRYPKGYQVLCNNCNGPGGKSNKKKCPMSGRPH
jgi:hypothetical protein